MVTREESLSSRIGWYLFLRTVIVASILLFTILMQARSSRSFLSPQLAGLYLIAVTAFLLTILYASLFRRLREKRVLGMVLLLVDNLMVGFIIIFTGGVDSLFSVLFIFAIIGASIIYFRRGVMIMTFQASLVYAAAVAAPALLPGIAWLDLEGRYDQLARSYLAYRITVNTSAFFLVALLASYLSESLRRTGEALSARESDLADLKSLYQNIVQSMSGGLITTDLGGSLTSINQAAERLVRVGRERILGRNIAELISFPPDFDPLAPGREEEELRKCEGRLAADPTVILGITFSLLRDGTGMVTGLICSFQDLTQIKKMEERVKRSDRLAAIGEMAAGVAHEIRNPLASISGSIQVLREDLPVDEQTRSLMDIVTLETDRLNRIITDFLLFASPRPPVKDLTDLQVVLDDMWSLLQQSLGDHHRYRFALEAGEGERTGWVDATMIRQAFLNLAINAVQAMPDGGEIRVRLGRESGFPAGRGGTGATVVEFRDHGCGIPADHLDKIFAPFFSNKANGTGLGLSIVYKIVEQHGGTIEVENASDGGAIFRMRLPLPQPAGGDREGTWTT